MNDTGWGIRTVAGSGALLLELLDLFQQLVSRLQQFFGLFAEHVGGSVRQLVGRLLQGCGLFLNVLDQLMDAFDFAGVLVLGSAFSRHTLKFLPFRAAKPKGTLRFCAQGLLFGLVEARFRVS